MQQFRVYAGETKVDIDFSRFNYALVYLRLLEELQHRRFDLPKFPVEDPAWEVAAQRWRTNFAKNALRISSRFL
ncbi:hypothetical protein [Arcanobacterium phocae]|uniref:hypothetical protein n=1 Tax=Arcanobacterium phocae TaxID=131112 RepID=UPI000B882CDB|nr:hypothetical protein [Arcanobacterium phocae]